MSAWPHLARARRLHTALSGRGVHTGTFFGYWTVSDLVDYLAAVQYLDASLQGFSCPKWLATDAAGYAALLSDIAAEHVHATDAFAAASARISEFYDVERPFTPAGPVWDGLVAEMKNLGVLWDRIQNSGYCAGPDLSKMPQPKAQNDVDSQILSTVPDPLALTKPAAKFLPDLTLIAELGLVAVIVVALAYLFAPAVAAGSTIALAHSGRSR